MLCSLVNWLLFNSNHDLVFVHKMFHFVVIGMSLHSCVSMHKDGSLGFGPISFHH